MVAANLTRETLLTLYDQHASTRREEIDKQKLSTDTGLIKSYLLEMQDHGKPTLNSIQAAFRGTSWIVQPTADELLFQVVADDQMSYLEVLTPRHMAVHTTEQSAQADASVQRAVRATPSLDFTWLAGTYLQTVWERIIQPNMPDRFVTFRFEHQARYDAIPVGDVTEDEDDADSRNEPDVYVERRSSALAITEQSNHIAQFLPALQSIHAPFKAIKMLRLPASASQGGYDFWAWGKVTHRSASFRDGRNQILALTKLYEATTKTIEEQIWFQAENTSLPDGGSSTVMRGSPVVFEFNPPLSEATFANFIETTFERGHGPMRLQGNPIWAGARRVHVYGIDLHLWQRLYMEITPRRMLVVLPQGTCGNTVHRLATNIQRYLSPSVTISVGDTTYRDLIGNVFYRELGV